MRVSYTFLAVLAIALVPWRTAVAEHTGAYGRLLRSVIPGAYTAEEGEAVATDEAVAEPTQEAAEPDAPDPAACADECRECCADCCDPCCSGDCCEGPARLFDCTALRCRGIEVGGWLDQGITTNDRDPFNRFNGPVTFNDRSNEYQMNQFYLYAERATETCGCGWDIGGRVDLLYGTDHRFAVAGGLEDDWNTGQRFYGLAMPQAYVDVAVNDLTVRMGHFYTILGYESVMAPENFFYSHAYTMQYGQPKTHTGLLAIYELNDCWSFSAGFHRGWDQWEDNNDDLGFLGGITWTSASERSSLAFAVTTSDEDDAGLNNRFAYSLVFTHLVTSRLQWVLQHDLGYEDNGGQQGEDAEWYGINTYLFYRVNPCCKLGLRYEWFHDDDGTRVQHGNAAGGPPQGIFLNGVPGAWQEVAVGLNYKFNENVMWRSECRWDWVDPLVPAVGGPFNDYSNRSQFLWGNDLIIQF